MERNYLEWIHLLADVKEPYRPKFYSTKEEQEWARAQRYEGKNILWSLAGSSGHKVWPHLDDILLRILPAYPDAHVFLVGDDSCKILEAGWCRFDKERDDFLEVNSRIHLRSGKWTIRQSMAFAEVADLIIGTETGLLNAAGSMDTSKIITLSHSSPVMLTKHWRNVIPLQQPKGIGCPKSPCRQLHGADGTDPWMDCPKHEETGTALCQFHIGPEMMWESIQKVLGEAPALMKRAA
jgi:ADP-heptose:LPS heptosyltransferase